eukprot:COSAG01_NODE_2766_length_7109_cov_36.719686_2_plen_183_part_00
MGGACCSALAALRHSRSFPVPRFPPQTGIGGTYFSSPGGTPSFPPTIQQLYEHAARGRALRHRHLHRGPRLGAHRVDVALRQAMEQGPRLAPHCRPPLCPPHTPHTQQALGLALALFVRAAGEAPEAHFLFLCFSVGDGAGGESRSRLELRHLGAAAAPHLRIRNDLGLRLRLWCCSADFFY